MNTYLEWEDGIKFQVRESRTALVCGVLAIGFAFFILAMRILHPSGRGGGALLYLPLLCMMLGGAACFLLYCNRKLIVEEMNICYVNLIGKTKEFTLDEIGYCKIGMSSVQRVVLYDLVGNILCKLDFEMHGMAEFYQYLLDNRVRIEWVRSKAQRSSMFLYMIDALGRETAVCEEEICRCSEHFYEEAERVIHDWEHHNRQFDVMWEFGFAEYTVQDLERKCPLHMYSSSVDGHLEHIPESYECMLEMYLKREDGYVVTKRGDPVSIMLPYLSKTKSYQIGEKTRIRKMDEESMKEWLQWQLETLSKELPKHKYHTEALMMEHTLHSTAGIGEKKHKDL